MSRKNLALLLVLVLLITGFIFYNSLQSREDSRRASEVIEKVIEPFLDNIFGKGVVDANYLVRKGAHFFEFFVLGLVVFGVLSLSSKETVSLKYIFGYGMFYVLAIAVTDEFIQSFSDRASSVIDVLIDFTGAISAFSVSVLIVQIIQGIRKRNRDKAADGK